MIGHAIENTFVHFSAIDQGLILTDVHMNAYERKNNG